MFVLPDGRVLNTSTAEAPVPTRALTIPTQTWTMVDASTPDGGSAVMYRPGKFLKTGTSVDPDTAVRPSFATAYTLDMTQGSPTWMQVPSMNFARTYHTMVVLPDGNVLVTNGGSNNRCRRCEYGRSSSGTVVTWRRNNLADWPVWWLLGSITQPRCCCPMVAYLSQGAAALMMAMRPLINSVRRSIHRRICLRARVPVDQLSTYAFFTMQPSFSVATPDASQITSAALIRLGAVTHAFDQNQRYVPLTFQQATGGLTVQSPSSANLAPPGYYMLFIVNSNGVPSVASIIKVQ